MPARAPVDAQPAASLDAEPEEPDFRATLIDSELAVLTTGRNLAVSWCLGNIFPDPRGPGGSINPELDAINLERYQLFRRELERATRLWERHSRMNFVHLAPLDDRRKPSGGACDTALEHVWFRGQTEGCGAYNAGETNAGGQNEFDPEAGSPQNPTGYDRLLCVNWQILDSGKKRIPGLLAHETGHVVGLEHEHVRWPQEDTGPNNCKDNHPYQPVSPERALTPRDPWSIMGYGECVGSEPAEVVSPLDMLGAYYIFNWTERRVRDMAPQTGGRSQRLWAKTNQPGVLWYLPLGDRLLEWRFDSELAFETIERCLDADCARSDSTGHWHPIMGRFSGSSMALDVFMYDPGVGADLLLRNDGQTNFVAVEHPAPVRAIPVVGNFGSGARDQILWYRPGPASDAMWSFDDAGQASELATDVAQDDWRIPLTGHFRSRTHWTDILWYDPRDATLDFWLFNHDFSSTKSGPASIELLGVVEGVEYLPIIGNFDGDNRTDLFWYAPGSASDWLWLSSSNVVKLSFDSYEFQVDGEYHPIVGDFDGDGDDDLLWYRPALESDAGPSWLWYFDGPAIEVRALEIAGDYVPYVEDFDDDGCTDILWYDSSSPEHGSAIWRCLPQEQNFACGAPVPAPKTAYPIGYATGGY